MLESLFNKVAGPQVCNLIKKRLQHRCFPENFAKFLRAPFSQNTSSGMAFVKHLYNTAYGRKYSRTDHVKICERQPLKNLKGYGLPKAK